MREQYYVATPTIILYSQDVPPPSENPESTPVPYICTLSEPQVSEAQCTICTNNGIIMSFFRVQIN